MIPLRTLVRAATILAWASVAGAQSPLPAGTLSRQGQVAFEAKDYAQAAALWSDAAAEGDPDGLFGLALLSDGAYGRPRDLPAAFALYLSAAEAGLAKAQFNVAVMLDVGLGTARDARAAMEWYTRAALLGNRRAQYNLGLMIEAGAVGVPDPGRAAVWYREAAADLPAAAAKLASASRDPGERAGPDGPIEILFAARGDGALELGWMPDGSGDALFTVQTAARGGANLATAATGLRTEAAPFLSEGPVRVIRTDAIARDYSASDWVLGTGPIASVEVVTVGTRPSMLSFVDALAADLRAAGVDVSVRGDVEPIAATLQVADRIGAGRTEIVYGWRPDMEIAGRIAGLLPFGAGSAARFDPTAALEPGRLRIRIADGS